MQTLQTLTCALILISIPVWAQAPAAEVTGTITDATGARIAEAGITLTNRATNSPRSVLSNEAGVFVVPALPPGIYDVKVEKLGFTALVRQSIELQVGQVARIDFILTVGNVSQVIEVPGGAPILDTETTALGTVVENRRILELPLNGRNFLQLASLIPGATTSPRPSLVGQARMGGARNDFTLAISGQRISFNHYTLDGVENTDVNFNNYFLLPSIDVLQEFRLETGVFSAEFGRGTSHVNVTTKGGGNDFHGTLFEFLRNSELDAKNFFDRPDRPIPPFKRNQFGFTLGGPLRIPRVFNGKDRLFFMTNYEGLRERKSLTQNATVPLPEQRSGDFSALPRLIFDPSSRAFNAVGQVTSVTAFPGNRVPSARIHRVSSIVLRDYVPAPIIGGGVQANNFLNNEARIGDSDQFTARGDWIQNPASTWFARYSWSTDFQYVPVPLPTQGNNNDVTTHQGMLAHTRVLGSAKVNEFRASVTHMGGANIQTRAFKDNVVAELGIPEVPAATVPLYYGVPAFQIAGFTNIGDCPDCPWTGYDTVIQARDDFSWIRGKHSIRFGGDFRRNRFNQSVPGRPRGRFTFDGRFSQDPTIANPALTGSPLADFLLSGISRSESIVGAPVANYRNFHLALYFQDTWKVTPKLTVNLGLRWEHEPPWVDKHDSIVNLDFRWDNSMTPVLVRAGEGDLFEGNPAFLTPTTIPQVRDGRFGRGVFRKDFNDFGPRLGIAYSLTRKTVLRTGAGIYYVRDIGNMDFEVVRNPPFSVQRNEDADPLRQNLSFDRPFTLPASVPTFILANQYDEPSSYIGQWSFGIQRQLTSSMMLEATYLGSSGVHLRRVTSYNIPPPGEGNLNARRPFPQIGDVPVQNAPSHSIYHALQARLQKRFSDGLTVFSAFTWGKSIDNGSATRPGVTENPNLSNPYDLRAERGLSAFDFRGRWTTSWLYEIPIGRGRRLLANNVANVLLADWQLGGVLTLQDGMPTNVYCGPGNIQNGGVGCYPDSLGINPNLPRSQQQVNRFFNTDAFIDRLPGGPRFRYGNAGRMVVIGSGIINWDFSAIKNFRLSEHMRLEFRSELFNLPNHPIFGPPGPTLRTSTYGVLSNTIIDSRQIQFGLKLSF